MQASVNSSVPSDRENIVGIVVVYNFLSQRHRCTASTNVQDRKRTCLS